MKENLKHTPIKSYRRKKRMKLDLYPNISIEGFPVRKTNTNLNYEIEQQMQHNSNNALKDEMKMIDEQK